MKLLEKNLIFILVGVSDLPFLLEIKLLFIVDWVVFTIVSFYFRSEYVKFASLLRLLETLQKDFSSLTQINGL